jgi:RHS repeat-associated protein
VHNTYRYNPSGSQLSSTGTATAPDVKWVGTQGYRVTNRVHSDYYVRARHYSNVEGRWTSTDPTWPDESLYAYASASPISQTDPEGYAASGPAPPNSGKQCAWCPKKLPPPKIFHLTGSGLPAWYVAALRTEGFSSAQILTWRGWHVIYSPQVSAKYSSSFSLVNFGISEKPSLPGTFSASTSGQQWNVCVSQGENANCAGFSCTIDDYPGTVPQSYPTGLKFKQTATLSASPTPGPCNTNSITVGPTSFNLQWKSAGTPSTWTP